MKRIHLYQPLAQQAQTAEQNKSTEIKGIIKYSKTAGRILSLLGIAVKTYNHRNEVVYVKHTSLQRYRRDLHQPFHHHHYNKIIKAANNRLKSNKELGRSHYPLLTTREFKDLKDPTRVARRQARERASAEQERAFCARYDRETEGNL